MTATERPTKRRVARRYAVGVPKKRISACATRLVFSVTTKASRTTGFESWPISLPGVVWTKIPTIGRTRKTSVTAASATNRPPPSLSPNRLVIAYDFGLTRGRKPYASSLAWPFLLSTSLMNACAAGLFVLVETTQIPYCTFGCAQAGILITFTLPGHGLRVGRVDEARIDLTESRHAPSTVRTSGSWLTTFAFTAAAMFMFLRICCVYVPTGTAGRGDVDLDAVLREAVDVLDVAPGSTSGRR